MKFIRYLIMIRFKRIIMMHGPPNRINITIKLSIDSMLGYYPKYWQIAKYTKYLFQPGLKHYLCIL